MNNQELISKVHSAMYVQCRKRGYAAPVDVLMDLGVLPKQKYEDWRFGKVDYLERVCNVNLHKLSTIMHEMRVYAQKAGLKPSSATTSGGASRKKAVKATSRSFRCGSAKAAHRKLSVPMPPILWTAGKLRS